MKSSFLAVCFLGIALVACDGTGDPSTTGGEGGEGGEKPTTSATSSSSSSGMGGAGGAGSTSSSSSSGGPAVSADKLGQVCDPAMPNACPMGYSCVLLGAGATSGFCTLPCTGVADMTSCSTPNGFPGPGLGACVVQIQNQPGMFCGVVCGAQYNLPDMCPTGLTCKDTIDAATKMPGMDGKNDFCVP
jgi:hypothetical protein